MNDLRNPFGRTDKLTVPVPVRSNYDSPLYVLNNFISNLLVNLPPISGKERKTTKLQRFSLSNYKDRITEIFSYFHVFLQFSRHLGALVHTSVVLNEFKAFCRRPLQV